MSLYFAWAFQIITFQIFLKIFIRSNMAKFYDFQIKEMDFINNVSLSILIYIDRCQILT